VRYVVLVYEDEERWAAATAEQRQGYAARHGHFAEVAAELGIKVLAGEALGSVATATTLRRSGDAVVITDGPFAETAEQLGGFYLVDASNLDDVLEASRELIETIEIRPVGHTS
jgi:hypothetical protein